MTRYDNDQHDPRRIAIELMPSESEIPIASQSAARRFAIGLGVFYAAMFGLAGAHLPFFPVWLKAVGIDAGWIGIIVAVPAVTRFTVLPFITDFASRRPSLRPVLIALALLTTVGFLSLGLLHQALAVFVVFAMTACVWTPMLPLTEGYALSGIAHYRLHYGPLRLWGSVAFVAGALGSGVFADRLAPGHLIWVMVGLAALGAGVSFALQPLAIRGAAPASTLFGSRHLLRRPDFLALIAAAALIQGSHAAYYSFASITWQATGLSGSTIAGLWVLGVMAEIVIFALSPKFSISPVTMIVIGAVSATLRWLVTAQEPSLMLLAAIQLMHGLTYGLTLIGTMALLVRLVPHHVMARAQGYLAALTGLTMSAASVASGMMYADGGKGIYYLASAMALAGGLIIWLTRHKLDVADQPHSPASGG
jgi:PPP family 3-phenylpropionic acid transporter